jgi:hypothetical protein
MFPALAVAALLSAVPVAPGATSLKGVLSPPLTGDLREAARAFVLTHRDELGLPASSTLGPPRTFSTRFGGTVRFTQLWRGLEVYGADVAVTFDLQRRIVRVASSLKSYETEGPASALTGAQALAAGAAVVDGALYQSRTTPYGGHMPMAFADGETVRAGFLVWVPTVDNAANWHLAIDGVTGAELWRENRVKHGFAAQLYNPSPGSANVGTAAVTSATLGNLKLDGGQLNGERVRVYGCCPAAGCDFDAGALPRHAVGLFRNTTNSFAYYDLAMCDPVQRATNDPALHLAGDYVYPPVDPPPNGSAPSMQIAADVDEFSEVHAYLHANRVYDFLRGLSLGPLTVDAGFAPFTLRDERLGRALTIQVNASETVFPSAPNALGVYANDTLARFDDARFYPRENMAYLIPEQGWDTDFIRLSQASGYDTAYDGTVTWHEFTHGALESTSRLVDVTHIDERSSNPESPAINEGIADTIAHMLGQDPRIGVYPATHRQPFTLSIRDATNTMRCPGDFWGESHQDSNAFSGAIWDARSTVFYGTDQGRTFDAAFYAAIVSLPREPTFEIAAEIISHAVGLAFPANATAEAQMKQFFEARGVRNCSKVVDVSSGAPRDIYLITSTSQARLTTSQLMPGPYQLAVRVPNGARSFTVTGTLGQGSTSLRVLARAASPITFKRASGGRLTNDAERSATPTFTGAAFSATGSLDVPCGSTLYLTVANFAAVEQVIAFLSVSTTPALSCPPPVVDAGAPDAGGPPPDAGGPPPPITFAPLPDTLGATPPGCGCGATAHSPLALGIWLLALRARRRSSARSTRGSHPRR